MAIFWNTNLCPIVLGDCCHTTVRKTRHLFLALSHTVSVASAVATSVYMIDCFEVWYISQNHCHDRDQVFVLLHTMPFATRSAVASSGSVAISCEAGLTTALPCHQLQCPTYNLYCIAWHDWMLQRLIPLHAVRLDTLWGSDEHLNVRILFFGFKFEALLCFGMHSSNWDCVFLYAGIMWFHSMAQEHSFATDFIIAISYSCATRLSDAAVCCRRICQAKPYDAALDHAASV